MNIATQCAECCECPTAVRRNVGIIEVTFASRTVDGAFLCGLSDPGSESCERFLTATNPTDPYEYDYVVDFWVDDETGQDAVPFSPGSVYIVETDTYTVNYTGSIVINPECDQEEDTRMGFEVRICRVGTKDGVVFDSGCVDTGITEVYVDHPEGLIYSNPDTIENAIARVPDPVLGTSNCASTGIQDPTTCTYGGSTSVTATVTFLDVPSTTYSLVVTYHNSCGEDELPDTYTVVEVTTDAIGAAEFELSIPMPDEGCTRCLATITTDTYAFAFKPTKIGYGTCYRIYWVERFIPEAGVGIDSVDVVSRGVYRPTVTFSAPLAGGTQAAAIAVMDAAGGVTGLSILNPGAGYIPLITFSGGGGTGAAARAVINAAGAVTFVEIISGGTGYTSAPTVAFSSVTDPRVRATGTATVSGGIVTGVTVGTAGDFRPTVTVATAINSGTSSTGWVAALDPDTGQVTTITGGSAGNYLPTLTFSAPGGSPAGVTALATTTMDTQGGIATVVVGTAGTKYTSTPSVQITEKVAYPTAARLNLRLGTEEERSWQWSAGDSLANGRWFTREVEDAGHALVSIEVVHGGYGFLTPPTVSFSGGGGSGAVAEVSGFGTDGKVTAITVISGGSGYASAPTVTISGRGGLGGATATATVNDDGEVTAVDVEDQGDYLPLLSISAPGGGGTPATATVTINNAGAISGVTLTSSGSGYKNNPALILSHGGDANVLLAAHFGTETEYIGVSRPGHALPVGYVPSQINTWLRAGDTGTPPWTHFSLLVPTTGGLASVENVQEFCLGCT